MKYILCCILAAAAMSSFAAWKTERKIDEMTDAVSYWIETYGDPVGEAPFVYRPGLLIRVKPSRIERTTKKLTAEIDVIFGLGAMDTISFTAREVMLRFDDSPAEDWRINHAKSPEAFFINDTNLFLKRLASATKLKARVDVINTMLTLNFHVAEFQNEMELVKNAILKTRPAGIQIYDGSPLDSPSSDPPSSAKHPPRKIQQPPKCSKCGGTGEVVTWKRCRRCYGSGTSGGAPCPKCRTSSRKGYIKQSSPCSTCKKQLQP